MRKVVCILLLSILFFSQCGYSLLMQLLEQHAGAAMQQQLDQNNYSDEQLVYFKVPLYDMPYYNNSADFENRQGFVEVNGMLYNYVKLRVYNGSLEVYCIPNKEAAGIRAASKDILKQSFSAELPGSKKSGANTNSLKYFAADYILQNLYLHFQSCHFSPIANLYKQPWLPFYHPHSIYRPPEHYC